MRLSWLAKLIQRGPSAEELQREREELCRRKLLADYIISRIRMETGLSFDFASAKELRQSVNEVENATLTDGKTTMSLHISVDGGHSSFQFDALGKKFQLTFLATDLVNFKQSSDGSYLEDLRSIVADAVATFPYSTSSDDAASSEDIEEIAESVSLVCMELCGETDAGVLRWVEEAAKILEGTYEIAPEYPNADPSFKYAGNLWAQIRLPEPRPRHEVIQILQLQPSPRSPMSPCQKFSTEPRVRDEFGLDRVYLRFRVFDRLVIAFFADPFL